MKTILFITRKYPPKVGGMQKYCYELVQNLRKNFNIELIANRRGQVVLPFFYIYAFIVGLIKSPKADIIYLGDTVMSPLGWLLKIITGKKTIITVYGLDLTYSNLIYKYFVLPFIDTVDRIVAISTHTKKIAAKNNVNPDKIEVINIGINEQDAKQTIPPKNKWMQKFQIGDNNKILITVGRLVKRKGAEWFIKEVLSNLDLKKNPNWKYFIIGRGKEEKNIITTINKVGLAENVFLRTDISNNDRDAFYKYSDLFIMPNIPVENDMEGFGIVAIEASINGLPVLTSGIEGVKDAIIEEKTGYIYNNSEEALNLLEKFLNGSILPKKDEITNATKNNYNWEEILKQYTTVINSTISNENRE